MKKICIEGPLEVGKWTEAVQAGFKAIGQDAAVHYHNGADTLSKISNRLHFFLRRTGLPGLTVTWKQISNHRVQAMVRRHRCEVLVSLHGLIDEETVQALRKINPRIRIIYWCAQQVRDQEQITSIKEAADLADVVALPYLGDCEMLSSRESLPATFLPFAACPVQHRVKMGSKAYKKFSKEVILIGDYSQYQEDLLCRVSEALGQAVHVWGQGWSDNQWITAHGPLYPPQSLQAFAAARIVLNLHGENCREHNGLNPKFFQIAAVGGFQITEDQPVLKSQKYHNQVATFKGSNELAQKVKYYLQSPELTSEMSSRLQSHILENETYGHRFYHLLKSMGYSEQ